MWRRGCSPAAWPPPATCGREPPVSTHVEVRRGAYFDSVSLMQLSRSVSDVAGVQAALVAMATPLNLELLAELGFEPPPGAGPNDLLIAIRGSGDDTIERAAGELEQGLRDLAGGGRPGGGEPGTAPAARTIRTAARRAGANLALISVPGRYAFAEAVDAHRPRRARRGPGHRTDRGRLQAAGPRGRPRRPGDGGEAVHPHRLRAAGPGPAGPDRRRRAGHHPARRPGRRMVRASLPGRA